MKNEWREEIQWITRRRFNERILDDPILEYKLVNFTCVRCGYVRQEMTGKGYIVDLDSPHGCDDRLINSIIHS